MACRPAIIRRWLNALALLCASFPYGASAVVASTNNETGNLEEAFIELRVTNTRGSGFYRVMVDAAENPYLDIQEALTDWLDLRAECQAERHYCQTTMQPGGRMFWIDGKQGQMGEQDHEPKPLADGFLRLHEGRLWLRHDAWSQWLPMNTSWTLYTYTLGFRPEFPLLDDLKRLRENERRRQYGLQRRQSSLQQLPALTPKAPMRAEGRYRFEVGSTPQGDENAMLDFDVVSDWAGGTLTMGGNVDSATDQDATVGYWRYRKFRQPIYHLFEVGDTRVDAGALLPGFNLEDGIRLDRLKRRRGAGLFELDDRTQPGTEIDIYRNGFLQSTVRVGQDGRYQIEEQFVAGGDTVNLRFYYPDGSQAERRIQIAPDNARILKTGQWDTQLLSGRSKQGDFSQLSLRYGLAQNFATGLHALYLPDDENGVPGMMVDMVWRPLYGLNLQTEALASREANDYSLRADITGLDRHSIQIEWRKIGEHSPVLDLPGLREQTERLLRVRHAFRLAPWGWLAEYHDVDDAVEWEFNLDRRFSHWFSGFAESDLIRQHNGDNRRLQRAGGHINLAHAQRFEFARAWGPDLRNWNASYRLQGGRSANWDINLDITLPDHGRSDWGLSIDWRATPRISLGVKAENAGLGLTLAWADVIAPKPGPRHWDEFATGTLTGQVVMPADGDGRPTPMAGVVVRANSYMATTDENGFYRLTGVPPDTRVSVAVDNNSLDAAIAPIGDGAIVEFRPGTHIDYNPKLSWTAGLDGVVLHPGGIPPGTIIEIVTIPGEVPVTSVAVESDGFFLAEGLTPGRYRLRLLGVEAAPAPLDIHLEPNVDWLPDLRWVWMPEKGEANLAGINEDENG